MSEQEAKIIDKHFNPRSKTDVISYRKVMLLMVLIFVTTFGISWTALSLSNTQKGDTGHNSLFERKVNEIGVVLGIQSPWNRDTAAEYLSSALEEIDQQAKQGSMAAIFTITPLNKDISERKYTLSSEYSSNAQISYTSVTSLDGESANMILSEDITLVKAKQTTSWAKVENTVSSEIIPVSQVLTIISNKKIQQHVVFKGVEKSGNENLLHFYVELTPKDLLEAQAIDDDKQVFFKEMKLNFWLSTTNGKIKKAELVTKNIFRDNLQYNEKREYTFLATTVTEEELKELLRQEEKLNQVASYELINDSILFFNLF